MQRNSAETARRHEAKIDYGSPILKNFPKFTAVLRERDLDINRTLAADLMKYDSEASVVTRLNRIVRHAKERLPIDNGDRKTNKPRVLNKIEELNAKLIECKQLMEYLSHDDLPTGGELSKAFELEFRVVVPDVGLNSFGFDAAYEHLCGLVRGVQNAQEHIKTNLPFAWEKTALSGTALEVCTLLLQFDQKPTAYLQGLAVGLLGACYEAAGGALSAATYKNAIQEALTQLKTKK
ncbi:hypothetical protein [Undibacterium parvum]|uniref:Uncharacterized protein n=2 Tax=Undibacterium TaxID=401469 RepID=A0A6M3ZZL5_9BURK|nr:hypothetical protein [Undibacterium parvum]AZP13552.1 hypothetical protein EJN92_17090 [Undibacterium parvum]QJQ04552.1 hypothetical protein EJG51_000360 [Undibacterium piscinae]